MDCKQFREVMDLYMDGELSSGATAAASLHSSECTACQSAASQLRMLRSAARWEVARVAVPAGLQQRLSAALDLASRPPAPTRAKRPYRWSMWPVWLTFCASPFVLLLLIAVPVGGRSMTANLLDRVAFHLDGPHATQITGKLICRDCTLEQTAGMSPACERHGHHGALLTSDGHIWNIIEDDQSERLIHDSSLLGKEFRLSGVLYRRADAIQVKHYALLS